MTATVHEAAARSVPRLEDERLLRGRGRFHTDVRLPGLLHLHVVRADVAHGRIDHVDTDAAAALPGVRMVVTAKDLPNDLTIPARQATPGMDFGPYLQRPLAEGWVRYVGEPVALVLAEDPYVAADAARLVWLSVTPADPLLDARSAADVEHVESLPGSPPALVGTIESGYGDVEAALAQAPHLIELELHTGRQTGMPLETRGLTASWDAFDERLIVWGAAKVPFWNRSIIASFLGLSERDVHLRESDVGGSFGIRGELYPEDLLVPWLAHLTRSSVRWVEDRAEHVVSANHAREQTHVVRAGFADDGELLVLDDVAWLDTGAYVRTHGAVVAALTAGLFAGPYRLPAFRSRVHVVVTNKTGVGTYRAPGRFQSNFVREQLLDVAASRLGMSPDELRTRNLLEAGEVAGSRPMAIFGAPMALDGADHAAHYRDALRRFDIEGWRRDAAEARARGRLVGVGTAPILEKAGLGFENATVGIDRTGAISVAVGSTSVGQGVETVMAQLVADVFGVAPHEVSVILSDTDTLPDGGGTFASRSTIIGGTAVHLAATAVADRARELAASIWSVTPDEVELHGGFARECTGERRLPFAALAALSSAPPHLRPGIAPGLVRSSTFAAPTMTYPYGEHFAMVEVDKVSGAVRVERYAVSYEIGRAVHPAMALGQVEGGVVQGIGGALSEELTYDDAGQPGTTSLRDYRLPTAADVPRVEVHLSEADPTGLSPLGVRGVGEAGIAGVGAAVAGAVRDALGIEGPVPRLPLTPPRVRALLREGDHG